MLKFGFVFDFRHHDPELLVLALFHIVLWCEEFVQYLFYLLYYVIAPIRNTKSLPLVSSRLSPLISNTAS